MTSVEASWLPPELTITQPYSMGPLTRWDPRSTLPAMGTVRLFDAPELAILGCFIAPGRVQAAARAQGERGIMMIRAKGLVEALGLVNSALAEVDVTPIQSAAAAVLGGQAFVDALHALEDGDD
jgi:hypothetical protein